MGADASGARNRRAVLALNRAGRRSPSRHAACGCMARRGHPLYRCRHCTEDCQPAWKPARHSDDRLQPTEGLTVVVEGDAVRITDQDALERSASVWRPSGMEAGHTRYATGIFTSTMKTNNEFSPRRTSCSPSNPRRSSHSPLASAKPATILIARVGLALLRALAAFYLNRWNAAGGKNHTPWLILDPQNG